MPSPFPGMDPFLEHPETFPSLHDRMIVYMAEVLQPRLPPPYFADLGQRVWIETERRRIIPDVDVIRGRGARRESVKGNGAVATLTRSKPIIITVMHDESRENFVEIRTRNGDDERLVATIEILSPSNKKPGDEAQGLYLEKQQEIIEGGSAHLVEIDLLRSGKHTTAIPLDLLKQKATPYDYHVCLRPFDQPGKFQVYPIEMPDRLPEISLPLLPGDGAVALDLQAVMDRAYDVGPYRQRTRYTLERLKPAAPKRHAKWLKQQLAQIAAQT